VAAYDPEAWTDLFVAAAGASAALAGLVFVAVSINVERILQYEGLPERALQTVLLLLSVLVASLLGLVPGQTATALGVELLIAALGFTTVIFRLGTKEEREEDDPVTWAISHWSLVAVGTLPFVIGAVGLLAESGGGLYWTLAGIVLATVAAVANAWVLLVEILR
jgi:modulator of FtsH protease